MSQKEIHDLFFSSRHPFKPYQKNTTIDDDDDEYIDITEDIDDEIVDAEQISDHIAVDDSNKQSDENNMVVSSDIDIISSVLPTLTLDEDEFISEDEEPQNPTLDLDASMDNENKQILEILYKTYGLLIRTRKLVKLTRNVCAIDQHVRNQQNGPNNGFINDIRVSSTFFVLKFSKIAACNSHKSILTHSN